MPASRPSGDPRHVIPRTAPSPRLGQALLDGWGERCAAARSGRGLAPEVLGRDSPSTRTRDRSARLALESAAMPPANAAEGANHAPLTPLALLERIRPWFEAVNGPTVCVTHGGVMRVIFRLVERTPENATAALEILQDRVLKLADGKLEWL